MIIIHIIPEVNIGGAENSIIELSNQLIQRHDVSLIVIKNKINSDISSRLDKSISIITLSKANRYSYIFKLMKVISVIKPDVVHGHLMPALLPLIIVSFFYRNIVFLYTLHFEKIKIKYKYGENVYKSLLRFSKIRFIALSDFSANFIKSYFKQSEVFFLPNGVKEASRTEFYNTAQAELESLKYDKNTKVFISVGRIVEVKNFRLLIEVFKLLKARNINAILVIIGDPPDENRNTYNDLISSKANNTFLLGYKSNVSDYLQLSYCYLCSSFSEGLSMAIIEALSCALPLVCTNFANVSLVLDDENNGIIVRTFEVMDYYNALLKIEGLDNDKYLKMGVYSHKIFVDNYSISRVASKYEEIITHIKLGKGK